MLKIKDNVPLEELEKYGFEKDKYLSNNIQTVFSAKESYQRLCFCEENDRVLYLYEPFTSNAFILKADILYDLIKADLVEKVKE